MSRYGLIRGYLLVHDGKHRRKLYFNVRDRSSVEACLAPGLPLVLDKSMDDVELISASPSGLEVRIAGKTYTWSCAVPDEFGKWVLAIIRSKSLKDCGWNYFGDSKDVVYAIEDNNKVRQTNGGCTEVSTWLDGDCLVRTTTGESTTATWLNTGNVKTTFRDGKVVKSSTQNKKTTTIFPDGRVEERDRGVLIEKLGRMERRTQPDGSYTEFEDQTHRHYDKYKRLEYTVFFGAGSSRTKYNRFGNVVYKELADGTVLVHENAYGHVTVRSEAAARQEKRRDDYRGQDVELTEAQAQKLKTCLENTDEVLAVLKELRLKPKDRPVWRTRRVDTVNYVRFCFVVCLFHRVLLTFGSLILLNYSGDLARSCAPRLVLWKDSLRYSLLGTSCKPRCGEQYHELFLTFWLPCLQVYSGDNETMTKHSLGTSVIQYAKENSLKSLDVLEAFVY